MQRYTLNTKHTYEKNGEQKNLWLPCGTLFKGDDGKMFIQMNDNPAVKYYVFEEKPRQTTPAPVQQTPAVEGRGMETIDYGDVNNKPIDDIPF